MKIWKVGFVLLCIFLAYLFLPKSCQAGENDHQLQDKTSKGIYQVNSLLDFGNDITSGSSGLYCVTPYDSSVDTGTGIQGYYLNGPWTTEPKIYLKSQDLGTINSGQEVISTLTVRNEFQICRDVPEFYCNWLGMCISTDSINKCQNYKLEGVKACAEIWIDKQGDTKKDDDTKFSCVSATDDIPADGQYYRLCAAEQDFKYKDEKKFTFKWNADLTRAWNDLEAIKDMCKKTGQPCPDVKYRHRFYITVKKIIKDPLLEKPCTKCGKTFSYSEYFPDFEIQTTLQNYIDEISKLPTAAPNGQDTITYITPGTGCPTGQNCQTDPNYQYYRFFSATDLETTTNAQTSATYYPPHDYAYCGIYCDTKFTVNRQEYDGRITSCTVSSDTSRVGQKTTFTVNVENTGSKPWKAGNPGNGHPYMEETDYDKSGITQTEQDYFHVAVDSDLGHSYRWGIEAPARQQSGQPPTASSGGSVEWEKEGTKTFTAAIYHNDQPFGNTIACDKQVKVDPKDPKCGRLQAQFTTGYPTALISPEQWGLQYEAQVMMDPIQVKTDKISKLHGWSQLYYDEGCSQAAGQAVGTLNDIKSLTPNQWSPAYSVGDIGDMWLHCQVYGQDPNKCCYVLRVGYCSDDASLSSCAPQASTCFEKTIATRDLTIQISADVTTTGPPGSETPGGETPGGETPGGTGTGGTGTGGGETPTPTPTETTTSDTTTTSETTTTTTTPVPLWRLNCTECEIGQNCTCNLEGLICTNGTLIGTIKEGSPINPFSRDIPPQFVNFTPNSTGKIEVVATCFEPFSQVISQVVQVNPEFLVCPTECTAKKSCNCTVSGCSAGMFIVNKTMGDPIPSQISLSINSTSFVGSFTPINNGRVEATAACTNPIKMLKKSINITGYVPVGNFTAKGFACVQITNGYRCTLSYENRMDSDARVVFMFANVKGFVVNHTGPYIVGQSSADLDTTFSCDNRHGLTFYASWNAYMFSDTRLASPVAYSKSSEVRLLTC